MKKNRLVVAAVCTFLLGSVSSCDLIEECATCRLVQEDEDGNIISEGTPLPYCGEALEEKQNELPVTSGGITSYWICE